MTPPVKTLINTWTRTSLGTVIVGLGLITWTGYANAADIVCQGTLFGDTDFAAYYGDENGFGRIELKYQRGGSIEVPLQYVRRNNQGEAVFRGNNPDQTSDVVEVFAPTPVRSGTRIRVTYNGNPATGTCSGTGESRLPSSSTPTEGSFSGRGQASSSVFERGRQADASLDFNRNGFNLGLSVPPGTGAQVQYLGTINRLRGTNPDNPNSFVLEGRVESFASSANNLRVMNTAGTCRIEVLDARITSVSCSANAPSSSTRFTGMSQF